MRDRLSLFQTDRAKPILLFRQHFILFHGLYRLQQTLLAQQQGLLRISPLEIVLHPYLHGDERQHLEKTNLLRNYYLDLSYLSMTKEADVEALMGAFWRVFSRQDQRREALQVLGLADPIDDASIQRRYRQLVMHHHPDRGGDTQRLQLLNAAIAALRPKNP